MSLTGDVTGKGAGARLGRALGVMLQNSVLLCKWWEPERGIRLRGDRMRSSFRAGERLGGGSHEDRG